jgi:hypothetical protein
VRAGVVAAQGKKPGAKLAAGSSVSLVVSKA